VSVVIAKSFARIFYRNAFNIGLPILESEEAYESFEEESLIQVDLESGEIRGDNGVRVTAKPLPPFMREIVEAGGLVAYIKQRGSL
jgi:3-isopropylmalate/(R)-2-methylmalate dehydratase small subunit